jgi:hypothetical protein
MAHGVIVFGSCGNFSGPAGDEWNAVAAFPGVALGTTEVAGAAMVELLGAIIHAGFDLASDLGAVVAGEDDERIVSRAGALQGIEHLSDAPVDLMDEVAVFACP